jgi:hypothetical protein
MHCCAQNGRTALQWADLCIKLLLGKGAKVDPALKVGEGLRDMGAPIAVLTQHQRGA